jgi:hypothetical protein
MILITSPYIPLPLGLNIGPKAKLEDEEQKARKLFEESAALHDLGHQESISSLRPWRGVYATWENSQRRQCSNRT